MAPPVFQTAPAPSQPSSAGAFKRALGPLGVIGVLIVKFFAKVKYILWPLLKFLPIFLKTGGTMLLSIWVYTMFFGLWFAVGVVFLIFIHESGHLLAAKRLGLKVGAPVFIPFMGAFIALKQAPRNAWIESQVGIGGPMLGTMGAGICELIHLATGNPLFRGLAYFGFMINLFNLTPVGFLDGGRIATALSPWLWVIGFVVMAALAVLRPGPIVILVLLASLPRLFFLFRKKSDEQKRYFEVTPAQRLTMAVMYFGLIGLLVLGMHVSTISPEDLQ
jgi:Zn-dependent protease